MKALRIAQTIALIVTIYAALGTANAQNPLPDAQDQACWQDLNSLRQCVATQQQMCRQMVAGGKAKANLSDLGGIAILLAPERFQSLNYCAH